ncbi:MAG: hypothetical protein KME31_26935 [Tolypothrix carrinoi HA7290-LM1]|jgi:hypothetical protein|nr:hypothetical protein [Tolypothrix carrinoi HA7290-LM1]
MSKFYNNVKSKLNKKGIKGLTKTDYLLAAEHLGIEDLDNPSTEEINAGVNYLMKKQSSELTTIENLQYDVLANDSLNEDAQAIALSEINQAGDLLAIQDKADLVASTAESMGIQLQLSEVDNIASNLDYSGDSLDEGIDDIRSAITAFVEYKAQINQQKINHMIGEVRAAVNQHNQQTSQHLNNGLSQIAKDINQADTDFKSSVRQALKCFAIPANKAG